MSHDIEIRKLHFTFEESNVHPKWNTAKPEWSHMVNGASLVMPYLEPFLIKTLREAVPLIEDEELLKDMRGFIGQEAQHYTNHRRYNEMLKSKGYSVLADVEDFLDLSYKKLCKRSLTWKLAYSAGFETMTQGVTEWLIDDRVELFGDADPFVTSLVLWHFVEEAEHKTVAFEVFQAVSGSYWLRILGLLWGSLHVGLLSRRGYREMLIEDGTWGQFRSRLRLWKMVLQFFKKAGPAMLRAMTPWHHPSETGDPEWADQWRRAYASKQDEGLPILETRGDVISADFPGFRSAG